MNEPTPSEWVQQALFGLDELSAAYHEGGADGHGLTVKEFREHRDSIRAQLLNAAATLAAVPAHTPGALDVPKTEHEKWRTKAPYGWASWGATLFVWDDAEHTKWHAVYDLDPRAHSTRNLHEEAGDIELITALLNRAYEAASPSEETR